MENPTAESAAQTVRPTFPKRAVVTAGMPYGNKDLHFGHVGGVFVHADTLARFLRDRIGPENVIFVSGTDCYGSAIVADYEQRVNDGLFSGDIQAFVTENHHRQAQTLRSFAVEPDCYAASGLEPYREIHQQLGADILTKLHEHGHLEKRSTSQFYDSKQEAYLNGRQVRGRCPIAGCNSENAYADECSLGHQYEPSELIDPVSTFTGEPPEMREVTNWYLKTETFRDELTPWLNGLLSSRGKGPDSTASSGWRDFSVRVVQRYFEPPTIYMKRKDLDDHEELVASLPQHHRERAKKDTDKLVFTSLADQDLARTMLSQNHCQYRSGTTLVPFRLTGNLQWGLPVPTLEGLSDLTFWVWPESLWAPISFTTAHLEQAGREPRQWEQWWASKEARVYQLIGEDNLFYYGLAEMALFLALQGTEFSADPDEGKLQLPCIIANRHLLFLDKKASSSGKVKPPLAKELLEYYTADQLRIHFLSLGLSIRNVSFRPKPFDPNASATASDPVLKDGNVLSNAFNKAIRSCFYTAQKFYDRRLPSGSVSDVVLQQSKQAVLDYERAMSQHEFHLAVEAAAAYIREINKLWTTYRPYSDACQREVRDQAVLDAFYMVRIAVVLMHPIAPVGTEKVREQLGLGTKLWDWAYIFEPLDALMEDPSQHQFEVLPPRADFFEKPACQFESIES